LNTGGLPVNDGVAAFDAPARNVIPRAASPSRSTRPIAFGDYAFNPNSFAALPPRMADFCASDSDVVANT
jgi:hypothetical protein